MASIMKFHMSVGLIYLAAFSSLLYQWSGLYGYNGLLPAHDFVKILIQNYLAKDDVSFSSFLKFPSLVLVGDKLGLSVDPMCAVLLLSGLLISSLIAAGLEAKLLYALLWICYLSLVLVGRVFLSFQWDILLLETGFLCIWSSNWWRSKGDSYLQFNWCYRFLAWKLYFLAGVVKLQSQCFTWKNFTALEYHFATQCLPTPLSWWSHQLPPVILRASIAATLLIEIPFSFLLIYPTEFGRKTGVILQSILQIIILLTGNYNFFNILALALLIPVWAGDFHKNVLTLKNNVHTENPIDENVSKTGDDVSTGVESLHKKSNNIIPAADHIYPRVFRESRWLYHGYYWAKVLDVVLVLVFLIGSVVYMVRVEILPTSSTSGSDASPFGSRVKLSLAITYEQMQSWFLPSVTGAIGTHSARRCYGLVLEE